MPTGLTLRSLRSQQETRFASGATPIVMTGLVPAIGRGTVALLMAGTRPAMTVTAGFTQGGPTDGRCELAMMGIRFHSIALGNSSSNALAIRKSAVSKPSVNRLYIGLRSMPASALRCRSCQKRAKLSAVRNSQESASCRRAASSEE